MATEYGVTDQGFVIKTLSEIKDEIGVDLKSYFGNQINLTPESVFGQLRDVYAEREHELWELAQDIYNSQYPQTASGVSLENILDFSALEKIAARESTVQTQALFGTISTVISSGTQVTVENDPTTVFSTDSDVTLVAGTDEIQDIAFSATPDDGSITFFYNTEETTALAYDDATAAATLQTYLRALDGLSEVTVSGSFAAGFTITFAGVDGKQEQLILVEGTNTLEESATPVIVTITETTPGVYQGTVSMTCTETGANNANAKTLTVINTPVSGFTRTFNVEDATLGRDQETDAEAKIRRNSNLVTSRSGPVEAIKNKILDLNGDEYVDLDQIESVIVYENATDSVDVKSIPAHGVMAVVRQVGDVQTRDQEIAQAIFDSKCAGIETSWGTAIGGNQVSKTVTDSMNVDHTINFARPGSIGIRLYLYSFTTNSDYPTDGDDQLKTALVTWGNALGVGQDIIVYPQLIAQIANIPGITDFVVGIGKVTDPPPPTSDDNVIISDGTSTPPEYSTWDTTDITINHV